MFFSPWLFLLMSQATPAANVSQRTDNCPAGLWGENAGVVIFLG